MPTDMEILRQGTLTTIAVVLFCASFNIWGARHLPLFEGLIFFLLVSGIFVILIPLWCLAPKVPPRSVFLEFENFGGWSSTSVAVFIGQIATAGAFVGADSAAHMAEEVRRAKTAGQLTF